MKLIPVCEIFGPTIQGEGPNTGLKCIFVRVVGCDFNCEWCDSKYAWQKDSTTVYYTPQDLAEKLVYRCEKYKTGHIILTGGNPCLYDFQPVIDILHNCGIKVDIETQGSILPHWLNKLDLVVISPKAPSSGQKDVLENVTNWIINKRTVDTAIKIPVFNDNDIDFVHTYYSRLKDIQGVKFYVNVGNDNTMESGDISGRILDDYRKLIEKICGSDMCDVYIMPQVHTLVWGNKQGV